MQDSTQDSRRDEFLAQFDEEMQVRILKTLADSGIKKNDPIFSSLLFITGAKETLERGPGEIRQAVDYGIRQFLEAMEDSKQVAVMTTEKRIASAVNALIQQTQESQSTVTRKSILIACFAVIGVLFFGAAGGWAVSLYGLTPGFLHPSEPRELTAAEVVRLEWAMSPEGRYAKQVVAWNEGLGLIGRQCEEDARAFNVTIQIGNRQATSGYCVLWVQPPDKRTFKPIQPVEGQ